MTHELLRVLLALTLASSGSVLLALGLRHPVRRWLGAATACSMWLLVPICIAAVLLPRMNATGAVPSGALGMATPVSAFQSVVHFSFVAAGADSQGAWPARVLCAWIAGAAALFCCFLAQQRAFVKNLGIHAGSRRVLRMQTTPGCAAVMGLLRPRLILPSDFRLQYSRIERRLILSHERAHLHRGDLAWNALAALLRCLFWFNPLAHLAAVCFRTDQELACDAAVMLRHPGLRRTYADAMLKTQLAEASSPLGCAWTSGGTLKERLRMLGRALPGPARRASGRVCVALTCLATGYAAWATQPPEPPTDGATPPAVTANTGEPQTPDGLMTIVRAVLRWQAATPKSFPLELQIDGQTLHFATAGREFEVNAARAITDLRNDTTSLQGDVRFQLRLSPASTPDHSPVASEQDSTGDSQILTLKGDTADMTKDSLDIRIEDGCTVALQDRSGQELWSLAGTECTLHSLEP